MNNLTTVRWVLGVFLILGAFGALLQLQVLAFFCWFITGLLLCPLSYDLLIQAAEEKVGFEIPKAVPIALGVVLFLISPSVDLNNTTSTSQTSNETTPVEVDIWQTVLDSSDESVAAVSEASSSNTVEDWDVAVKSLENTVLQFKNIPSEHPGYAEAQKQITAYSKSLEYAQKSLEKQQQKLEESQLKNEEKIETVIIRNPDNNNTVMMQFKCPSALGTLVESSEPNNDSTIWEPSELANAVCNGQTTFAGGILIEKVSPTPTPQAQPSPSPTPTPQAQPSPSPTPTPQPAVSRPARQPQSGNCECPYDRDSAGRNCGRRSAYYKTDGGSPVCYTKN
ncbi:hypothetical protein VB712_10765 [Spirulina sp. CCNP1310]|uniref:hypothetical protein n=1 Tax=Spirulina sp. CCNP1310 TaxID=3110249 RepID=UPI002B206D07|nr:hypothetical protein [Spirulina sp. CCNP1310]MEA5419704.1 hypothetical protein [Spirulina sp. CCNP1310]